MRESKKREANVWNGLGFIRSKDSISVAQVRMNGTECLAGGREGAKVSDGEVGVSVHQTDQLTAGVTGRTKNCNRSSQSESSREREIYAYALRNAKCACGALVWDPVVPPDKQSCRATAPRQHLPYPTARREQWHSVRSSCW